MTNTALYDAAAAAAAARHGVPVSWIKAVIGTETSFGWPVLPTWEARRGEYSYGPMQILLSTARDYAPGITAAELAEPWINLDIGAEHLARLRSRVGEDFRAVYSAYNSGSATLWQTSAAVRANVERALGWLTQFAGPAELTAAPLVLLLAAWAVWHWQKGKSL